MKKKTFVVQTFLISLLVVALVLTSCEFGIKLAEESDNEGLVTPYTNMSNLSIARSVADEADPDIVNWKVARFFALIEKIDFESVYPWHGAKVSEYPVLIYYADSNKPRYYEFRVIKNGVEIGSITCNASKSEGMPVAYVSEMAHKVTAETAKKLVNPFGGAKLATVNYPTQFVLRDSTTTARSVIEGKTAFKDALTEETIKPEQAFIERRVDEFLNQADKESLAKLEITPKAKAEMLAEAEEFDADMKVMWDGLEEIMPNILAVTDEEIEREYKNPDAIITETARHIYKRETTYEDNMLYDWVNKKNWGPYNISMWCGPSVVSYDELSRRNYDLTSEVPKEKVCTDLCEWKVLCYGGCLYRSYIKDKSFTRNCRKSLIESMNNFFFLLQLKKMGVLKDWNVENYEKDIKLLLV